MNLSNIRIGVRLGLCFAVMLALMVVAVGVAVGRIGQLREANRQLIDEDWVKSEAAQVVDTRARANARRTMELLIADDPERHRMIRARIDDNKHAIDEALATLDRLVSRPEGKRLLLVVRERRAAYVTSFTQVAAQVAAGQREAAVRTMNAQTLPAIDQLQDAIRDLKDFQTKLVHERASAIQDDVDQAWRLLIGLAVAALALGATLAWAVTRSITRPVGRAVTVAQTVAAGDLTSAIEVRSNDETGQLLGALRDMNDNLVQIVGRVHDGSEAISTASGQIAAGNHDLSQRTEEQAAALQQTTASLQELSGTVKNNRDAARQAHALAVDASTSAADGGGVVAQVQQSMRAIEASARGIADIVAEIDGIAFQTNLLALNAAVEAARAGDVGRGFAVVANEVRTLAGRASSAAHRIKDLAGESLAHVAQGRAQVDSAGEAMGGIVHRVQRVTALMGDISQASDAQAGSLDQISQAMGQMDHVTQGNAALVEEAAAATESLARQARALVAAVGAFRLAPAH